MTCESLTRFKFSKQNYIINIRQQQEKKVTEMEKHSLIGSQCLHEQSVLDYKNMFESEQLVTHSQWSF
uniref:Uncharacterized protein n=1 Tax=Anguilla anguilla TaxID=7936 RepID=A0A0E9W5L4_ANGAN